MFPKYDIMGIRMSTFSIFLHFIGLAFLMACSSFFSGSETALTALSKAQIQRIRGDGKKSSFTIVRFLDEPRRLFITVLFGNTLVNMAFVSITGSLVFHDIFKEKSLGLAYVVAILFQTLLLLIFSEITPKSYALRHSEKFARAVAQPLWFFSQLIYPFRRPLRLLTDLLLPLFGVRTLVEETPLTEEEIRAIVKATEDHGALDKEEGEIIHSIFELHDIPAKEAMVPRTSMVCVEVSKTIQEAFAMTQTAGYSRLPVYRDKLDNICGVFYVKDMPRWKGLVVQKLGNRNVEQLTIEEFLTHTDLLEEINPDYQNTLVRAPLFVYETKKIGEMMKEMNTQNQQMAMLLDEYGGVSGLITVEDIVEEVLGEIFDEYDKLTELTISKDPDDHSSVLIPGFVSLRSVNKRMKLRLDLSVADTISGYVTQLMGAIPKKGDLVHDKGHGLVFEVMKMTEKKISLLKIRRKSKVAKKGRGKSSSSTFLFAIILFVPLLTFSNSGALSEGPGSVHSQSGLLVFSLLLFLSLLIRAFYAGSETAVVSASKARIDVLAQQGNTRALIIKKLWQEPDKLLGTTLVGENLMSTAAGVASLQIFIFALPGREGFQEFLNTIVMTVVILIFGEILPKTTFRAKADSVSFKIAYGLRLSGLLLRPVVSMITKITSLIVRIAGDGDREEGQRAMREELKLLAQMGTKEGVLKKEQLRMISSVLDLESMTLEKVMTPLVDVIALPSDAKIEDFYRTVSQTGFSRIPVYEVRVDNMIGMVNVLDVLYAQVPPSSIAPFVRRDIRHEPESKRVYALLRDLKSSRKAMVFVVDEYGGIGGLVTIEDLIEEILGDIRDEKDSDEEGNVHQISDNILECDGKTEISFINNAYGLDIPLGDYNTVAGYIISLVERIPKQGEIVQTNMLRIVVLDADQKSIRRVRIQIKS
jgi:putative hemolysin